MFFSFIAGRKTKDQAKSWKMVCYKNLYNLFYNSCKQWQFKHQVIIMTGTQILFILGIHLIIPSKKST